MEESESEKTKIEGDESKNGMAEKNETEMARVGGTEPMQLKNDCFKDDKEIQDRVTQLLSENNAEEAKRLLQKFDSITFMLDITGRTAIHWAANGGCLEIVEFCVSQKEDCADSGDNMGWTPLMIASTAERVNVVQYLLGLPQVDVNHVNVNGQTALHFAASRNQPQIVSSLLERGARVNAQDKYGATPLHRAAAQGHDKVVEIMLNADGIQIDLTNPDGWSALHFAVKKDHEDVAIRLVDSGADPNLSDKNGKHPMYFARTLELRQKLLVAETRYQTGDQSWQYPVTVIIPDGYKLDPSVFR